MIEIFDCAQGSDEWKRVRLAIPTASEFACVLAKGKDGKTESSKTRKTYLYKLMGECLTGDPADSYSNHHMERGKEQEAEARNLYGFIAECELRQVGFVRNGRKGCSPDCLIDANGGLEIKSMLAHLLVELHLDGEVPPEHKPQIQGNLLVCEREWWDFVAYCPKMKPFIKRVYRDEPYITALSAAIDIFNNELDTMLAVLQGRELRVA